MLLSVTGAIVGELAHAADPAIPTATADNDKVAIPSPMDLVTLLTCIQPSHKAKLLFVLLV